MTYATACVLFALAAPDASHSPAPVELLQLVIQCADTGVSREGRSQEQSACDTHTHVTACVSVLCARVSAVRASVLRDPGSPLEPNRIYNRIAGHLGASTLLRQNLEALDEVRPPRRRLRPTACHQPKQDPRRVWWHRQAHALERHFARHDHRAHAIKRHLGRQQLPAHHTCNGSRVRCRVRGGAVGSGRGAGRAAGAPKLQRSHLCE